MQQEADPHSKLAMNAQHTPSRAEPHPLPQALCACLQTDPHSKLAMNVQCTPSRAEPHPLPQTLCACLQAGPHSKPAMIAQQTRLWCPPIVECYLHGEACRQVPITQHTEQKHLNKDLSGFTLVCRSHMGDGSHLGKR